MEAAPREISAHARTLATVSFGLILFPVLVGVITLMVFPVYVQSGEKLAEPITKAVVRVAGAALVIAFMVVASNPRRSLAAWNVAAIAVIFAHLMTPLVFHDGIFAIMSWIHPFFLLPAIAALLSALSLCLMWKE